ncbi:MAG TPA: DUF4177 domain-containing protein [Gemmatimonadaceae bacterium]|nr:DUF4177 domain-containing protein [Gemmatimonadaceae bacterium]
MTIRRLASMVLVGAGLTGGALVLTGRPSAAKGLPAAIEYKAVPIGTEILASASAQQRVLDENGKEGWQLVLVTPVSFVFRR